MQYVAGEPQQVSEADAIAAKTEAILARLYVESPAHFMLAEIMWIQSFSQRLRFGTSAEQERKYLAVVEGIEANVRAKVAAKTGG